MSSDPIEVLRRMVEKLAAHVRPTCCELWEEAQAALASLSAPKPSGEWVLVPREATPEMWEAGMNCHSPDDTQGDYLEKAWGAMLAAAPKPESAEAVCPECHGEGGRRWYEADGSERGERCGTCDGFGTAPPRPEASAPVGVEWLVAEWRTTAARKRAHGSGVAVAEANGYDMAANGLERALAQQPAAVDEALERLRREGYPRLWHADLVGGQISVVRMREILTAALADQQQGGTPE